LKRPAGTKSRVAPPKGRPAAAPLQSVKIPWKPGILVALLGFLVYANTLSHHFVLDDYSVILENRLTRQGMDAFPEILTTSYRFGYYFTDDDLYRPLVKAMFAIEWAISPENAAPGHWINVLLYALTGCVLFRLLFRLTRGNMVFAAVAASLFMLHPIHTEVVANIKSRDEILSLLFCLLALGTFMKAISNSKMSTLVVSGVYYFLALASKESAITFLAVFPLAAWFFASHLSWKRISNFVPVAVAAGLFLLIRASVLQGIETGEVSVADNLLMAAKQPGERFATAVLILGHYLKLLVFPHPLVFDYSFNQIPIVNISNPWFLLSFLAYAALIFAALKYAGKKHFLSFCGLFFLITISIYSNIIITIGSSMGERFLYMPSLGFCLALGWLLYRLLQPGQQMIGSSSFQPGMLKPAGIAAALLIAVLFSVKTVARNPVWKNNATLYENDVHLSPNSTRTHYYLGNYLVKPEAWEGKPDKERIAILERGISELRKSIAIYSGFADAYIQMGVAYDKLNKPDSAFSAYQSALKLNPLNATIHNNIGTIYFKSGDYTTALKSFKEAVRLDPKYAEAHANAGSAYGMMQQYDNALASLFEAVRWDPGYAQAYYYIGLTYRFKGDEQNAKAYLAKASALDPKLK
jgi:tetratricopeptide (TPR) repeat protein